MHDVHFPKANVFKFAATIPYANRPLSAPKRKPKLQHLRVCFTLKPECGNVSVMSWQKNTQEHHHTHASNPSQLWFVDRCPMCPKLLYTTCQTLCSHEPTTTTITSTLRQGIAETKTYCKHPLLLTSGLQRQSYMLDCSVFKHVKCPKTK